MQTFAFLANVKSIRIDIIVCIRLVDFINFCFYLFWIFFLILYRLLIISMVWIMNLYRLQPWGTYLFPINFKILLEFWFFMFVSERNDLFLYFPKCSTLFCGLISLVLVLSQFWLYFQQQNSYKNTHTCIYMYIYNRGV